MHRFKLIKQFDYGDLPKRAKLELEKTLAFTPGLLEIEVKENHSVLHDWFLEHGAVIGERIII